MLIHVNAYTFKYNYSYSCSLRRGTVCGVRCAVCGVQHSNSRSVHGVRSSEWQCLRQCVAVRQCGSGRQYGSVRQCARMCAAVVRGCVRQCTWPCAAARTAVCGSACCSVWLSINTICGSVRQCTDVWQCGSVQHYSSVHIFKYVQNILVKVVKIRNKSDNLTIR
jgi:hypothetical protein